MSSKDFRAIHNQMVDLVLLEVESIQALEEYRCKFEADFRDVEYRLKILSWRFKNHQQMQMPSKVATEEEEAPAISIDIDTSLPLSPQEIQTSPARVVILPPIESKPVDSIPINVGKIRNEIYHPKGISPEPSTSFAKPQYLPSREMSPVPSISSSRFRCQGNQAFQNSSTISRKKSFKPTYPPKANKTIQKHQKKPKNVNYIRRRLPLCAFCKGSHFGYQCELFCQKPILDRWELVNQVGVCSCCLRFGHRPASCTFAGCSHCNSMHNSLLHFASEAPRNPEPTPKRRAFETSTSDSEWNFNYDQWSSYLPMNFL